MKEKLQAKGVGIPLAKGGAVMAEGAASANDVRIALPMVGNGAAELGPAPSALP